MGWPFRVTEVVAGPHLRSWPSAAETPQVGWRCLTVSGTGGRPPKRGTRLRRECWCPVCRRVTEHLSHDPCRWERLEGRAPALPDADDIEWECDEHWDDPRLFVKVRGQSTRPWLEMLPMV